MKSPRERRQLRTKEHILTVARDMVLQHGYAGLSLRAVAKAADYSPSGLYEYFSSKDELMDTLSRRSGDLLSEALAQAAAGADPLCDIGLAYIAFALENPEEFQLLFSRTRSKREGLDEAVTGNNPYGLLLGQVVRAQERGALSTDLAPEMVSYALWALVHGIATLRLSHLSGFRADFESVDRGAITALLQGLRPGVSNPISP